MRRLTCWTAQACCSMVQFGIRNSDQATSTAPVVGEHPTEYPETIQVFRECATDSPSREAVPALQALAVVSTTSSEGVPADEFETAVDRLSSDCRVLDATVADLQTGLRGVEQ